MRLTTAFGRITILALVLTLCACGGSTMRLRVKNLKERFNKLSKTKKFLVIYALIVIIEALRVKNE